MVGPMLNEGLLDFMGVMKLIKLDGQREYPRNCHIDT